MANFSALTAELNALKEQGVITEVEKTNKRNQVIISYNKDYAETAAALLESLIAKKTMPISLRKMNPSLESIFLEVIQ